jgi:hypothetical protein
MEALKKEQQEAEKPYQVYHHSQLSPRELPAVDLLKFSNHDPAGFAAYVRICRLVRGTPRQA